jgi:hypothetical protein
LEVDLTVSAVHSQPKRFPVIHRHFRRAPVSRFPYGVFFIAKPDVVVVVAVMHFARHPARAKSRR